MGTAKAIRQQELEKRALFNLSGSPDNSRTGSVALWLEVVRSLVGAAPFSLLDLCCGEMTATRLLSTTRSHHVDIVDWSRRPTKYEFEKSDVITAITRIPARSFDVAICSDGLEHLPLVDGIVLLHQMQRVASLSIIFTPDSDGGIELTPTSTNPDVHKHIWSTKDFVARGWNVMHFYKWHPALGIGAIFAWRGKIGVTT